MLSLRTLLPRSALASSSSWSSSSSSTSIVALRTYSTPTSSEQAAKADAYHSTEDKEKMQKDTVEGHAKERSEGKISASPNDVPTESEDVAHSHKNDKSPEELQKETAKKASSKP